MDSIPHPRDSQTISRAVASWQNIQSHFAPVTMGLSFRLVLARLSPSPWVMTPALYRDYCQAQTTIHAGIQAFAKQWVSDPSLRKLIPVHPRLERVLLMAPEEYNVGTFRPDVLHAADGTIRICELNARQPLNGCFSASITARAILDDSNSGNLLSDLSLAPVPSTLSLIGAFKKRLVHTPGETIFIVRCARKLVDTSTLPELMNTPVRYIYPTELCVQGSPDNGVFYKEQDGSFTKITSALLELRPNELLTMPDDVLEAVAKESYKGVFLNDLRTSLLMHNKCTLFVLRSDLLNVDDKTRKLLRHYLVPTLMGSSPKEAFDVFRGESLVLKPALYGEGFGVSMGKKVNEALFHELRGLCAECEFVVQPFIKQHKYEVLTCDGEILTMNTVGAILSLDGKFYGPGNMRSSADAVVSAGGYHGCPCNVAMKIHGVPSQCRSFVATVDAVDRAQVVKCLEEDGVAMIAVKEELKEGDLRVVLDRLGGSGDVKTVTGDEVASEVHTEGYADEKVPKYKAFSVMRGDHHGGSLLSLVPISSVVSQMSDKQVEALQSTDATFSNVSAPVLKGETARVGPCASGTKEFGSAKAAFDEIILGAVKKMETMPPQQCVLVIDNERVAHCVGAVLDKEVAMEIASFNI